MAKLRLADLSKNSMVHLPSAIGAWTRIYRLNLSANLLVDLPDEFCNPKNVRYIKFSR